jgi:hypothetical protein
MDPPLERMRPPGRRALRTPRPPRLSCDVLDRQPGLLSGIIRLTAPPLRIKSLTCALGERLSIQTRRHTILRWAICQMARANPRRSTQPRIDIRPARFELGRTRTAGSLTRNLADLIGAIRRNGRLTVVQARPGCPDDPVLACQNVPHDELQGGRTHGNHNHLALMTAPSCWAPITCRSRLEMLQG